MRGRKLVAAGAQAAPRDKPWLFRTYAGHSTAAKSNELYRTNLAKGQTGLSIAFDLPTQTAYDSDHELARGEVGKVGVPVCHLGDMRALLEGIPLGQMNTSMTINASAAWLLALYIAVADEQGTERKALTGTIQNDIIKEYLSRGTYVFPPGPSLRLIKDTIVYTYRALPKWNPTNVCSYHLQEAGATPVQELAFALATAKAVLDVVKASGDVAPADFGAVVGRISFFVNAGLRFVTEICKMRAFSELWQEITAERYGVSEPKHRLFATACRSILWASPSRSQKTTSIASYSRCWRSPFPRMPAPAPCNCRPGTKRSACRGPGTSSGRFACSRSWPTKRTCWSTAIFSKDRKSSTARSKS